jgi:hypothetical protein
MTPDQRRPARLVLQSGRAPGRAATRPARDAGAACCCHGAPEPTQWLMDARGAQPMTSAAMICEQMCAGDERGVARRAARKPGRGPRAAVPPAGRATAALTLQIRSEFALAARARHGVELAGIAAAAATQPCWARGELTEC